MTSNPAQVSAITADPSKPLMVLAGPGTGKTKTLIGRILYLLRDHREQCCIMADTSDTVPGGSAPKNSSISATVKKSFGVLALTFSKAATINMRDRLSTALSADEMKHVTVKTFHALCLQICRENVQHLGLYQPSYVDESAKHEATEDYTLSNSFTLFSKKDMLGLLVRIMSANQQSAESDIDPNKNDPNEMNRAAHLILRRIEHAKKHFLGPENFEDTDPHFSDIFNRFSAMMKREQALSFTDVISQALMLLVQVPSVQKKIRQQYAFVLCDEFQDTSTLQFSILTSITQIHGRITVIGDDDQLIYEFSGADKRNFERFLSTFEKFDPIVVKLQQNYRSTGNIVAASSALISFNTYRQAKNAYVSDQTPPGSPIHIAFCRTREIECAYVSHQIRKLLTECQCHPRDIAVIYRKNVHCKLISKQLMNDCIPISGRGSDRYLQASRVRGLITLMKAVAQQVRSCTLPQIVNVLGLNAISKKTLKTLCTMVEMLDRHAISTAAVLKSFAHAVGASVNKKEKKELLHLSSTLERLQRRMQELRLEEFVINAIEALPYFQNRSMDTLKDALSRMACNFSTLFNTAYPNNSSMTRAKRLIAFLDHVELHLESSPIQVTKTKSKKIERSSSKSGCHDGAEKDDRVWLGTVHQAKGLEWDHVFVLHMNEGEFPVDTPKMTHPDCTTKIASTVDGSTGHIEAERRLAFVAASRAKLCLTLTSSIVSTENRGIDLEPSRFLKEIPKSLVTEVLQMDCSEFHSVNKPGSEQSSAWTAMTKSFKENEKLWKSFWANPLLSRNSEPSYEGQLQKKKLTNTKRGSICHNSDGSACNGMKNKKNLSSDKITTTSSMNCVVANKGCQSRHNQEAGHASSSIPAGNVNSIFKKFEHSSDDFKSCRPKKRRRSKKYFYSQ